MLAFNNKFFTISAFCLVLYLISISLNFKHTIHPIQNKIPQPNTEGRIKEIRERASGKSEIMKEKEISLQEQIVYSIIDYIAGEEFRKTFIIKHV